MFGGQDPQQRNRPAQYGQSSGGGASNFNPFSNDGNTDSPFENKGPDLFTGYNQQPIERAAYGSSAGGGQSQISLGGGGGGGGAVAAANVARANGYGKNGTGGGHASFDMFSHEGQGAYHNPYEKPPATGSGAMSQAYNAGGNISPAKNYGQSAGGGASSFNPFGHDGQGDLPPAWQTAARVQQSSQGHPEPTKGPSALEAFMQTGYQPKKQGSKSSLAANAGRGVMGGGSRQGYNAAVPPRSVQTKSAPASISGSNSRSALGSAGAGMI